MASDENPTLEENGILNSEWEVSAARIAFQNWVTTVRDPADRASEGFRRIETSKGAAIADYEIAPLPSGRWAVRIRCEFRCGDFSGVGIPWTDFVSREACIDFFLSTARRHFGSHHESTLQQQVQTEMKRLLAPGLFGFIEPIPSAEDDPGKGVVPERSTEGIDLEGPDESLSLLPETDKKHNIVGT